MKTFIDEVLERRTEEIVFRPHSVIPEKVDQATEVLRVLELWEQDRKPYVIRLGWI